MSDKTISALTEATTVATTDIFAMVVSGSSRKVTLDTAFKAFNLFRGTNVLEQRNGTSAQTFRLYNTYTDASNYERGFVGWASNMFLISTQVAGTGTFRDVQIYGSRLLFSPNATPRWEMNAVGNLIASTDNTSDIGLTNANRPRHAHLAGYVAVGDGIAAPGAGAGEARLYVDAADGDLKVVFADGVVKTIAVDT